MSIDVSVILPIYKQVDHIQHLVDEYLKGFQSFPEKWELIFVVNGPEDGSYSKLYELTKNISEINVFQLNGSGWGKAVKFGIEQAKGKLICYTNSSRTNIADLLMMLQYAKVNQNNIIKANRIVRDSFLRRLGSVIYNFEFRLLFKTPLWDVNGTPKIFPVEIIRGINIDSEGDLIDAEIMAVCNKRGIHIIEIPITATSRINGKSTTNLLSAFKMYSGLFKIRKIIKDAKKKS